MSESSHTVAQSESAADIVTTETGFAWTDAGIVVAVIVVAVIYLYRKLWHKRGACPECGNEDGHCEVKRQNEHGGVTRVPVDHIGGKSTKRKSTQ
jgi:hypothetical protein